MEDNKLVLNACICTVQYAIEVIMSSTISETFYNSQLFIVKCKIVFHIQLKLTKNFEILILENRRTLSYTSSVK